MAIDKIAQPPYCKGVMRTQNKLSAWIATNPSTPDRQSALRAASELRRRGHAVRVRKINNVIGTGRWSAVWVITNS